VSVATIETLPGVRPFVELGVGASYDSTSTAQWDVDHWDDPDDSFWVGDMPYWLDVTCHVQDVATHAGRERAIDQFEVGSATITVDNRSGLFDFPLSMEDLASDDTLLSIRPGRSIRTGVHWDGGTVLLWAGYIDETNPTYDAVEGARMVLECVDAKGDAGRAKVAAVVDPVGAGETVTERIERVLTAAGWPPYRRAIDTSGVTLVGTELGGQCVDLLNIAADSASGSVYGDVGVDGSDPRVVYRNSEFPNYNGTDPLTGTIGDFGSPGDTCPSNWELSFARGDISTQVLLARRDDETPRVYPTATQLVDVDNGFKYGLSMFGVEPFERSDLETFEDSDLDFLGERVLTTRSWHYMPRVAAVTVTAKASAPETIATLAAASPYTPARFRCQHRIDGRTVFNRIMFVTGVEHSITPFGWEARIALDDAEPFLVGGTRPARWDQTDVAEWDAATWADPT